MRQFTSTHQDKSRKAKYIVALLGLVLIGGVVSFMMSGSGEEEKPPEEEFQFVEFTPPPPPPPPPAPEEPEPEPEDFEEMLEPVEIPEDAEPSNDEPTNDLGIDIGDLAAGDGPGGFVMDIPKFGRRGKFSDDEDDPLGAGDAAEPPVPTLKTQPIYPSALLKKSIGGKVLVTAVVNISGQVIKATIKQSSGQSELDKAAVQAVLKWKFKPGKKNGKPVQATCLIPYTFEVKKN
jgi:protein TonB